MNDVESMRLALALAERGRGWTAPNPMVGAVIVKDGAVIGQGWHERYGEPHAERNALASCTADPAGATMYVTLEPCCHHGKQPPCVDAILASGIRRVVIGSADPNPLVAGKGVAILRAHGVEVTKNVLRQECDALNSLLPLHHHRAALRLHEIRHDDGWQDRSLHGCVQVGHGRDGPEPRPAAAAPVPGHHGRRGHRSGGRSPPDLPRGEWAKPHSRHLRHPSADAAAGAGGHYRRPDPDHPRHLLHRPGKAGGLQRAGCQVLCLNEENGHVDLRQLMERLGREQIDSILLEGGGTLNWAALECGIVQQVQAYIAPKLFGGRDAKTPVEGVGVPAPTNAFRLKNSRLERLGEDLLIESEVEYPCSQES